MVKGLAKSITTDKNETLGKSKREISPRLKKFMDEECQMVKGRFKNYETEGGNLPLTCGKYPGQPLFSQTFQDGEIYEVPLWIARHLNGIDVTAEAINGKIGSCSYVIHGFKWDKGAPVPESQIGPGGAPVPHIGSEKRKRRFGFQSLEFDSTVV